MDGLASPPELRPCDWARVLLWPEFCLRSMPCLRSVSETGPVFRFYCGEKVASRRIVLCISCHCAFRILAPVLPGGAPPVEAVVQFPGREHLRDRGGQSWFGSVQIGSDRSGGRREMSTEGEMSTLSRIWLAEQQGLDRVMPGWVISGRLGAGGAAKVFRVESADCREESALKVIRLSGRTDDPSDGQPSDEDLADATTIPPFWPWSVDAQPKDSREEKETGKRAEVMAQLDTEAQERLQEVRIMRELADVPGVVQLQDYAVLREEEAERITIFIRMELLEGLESGRPEDLLSHLMNRQRRLSDGSHGLLDERREVLRLGIELCEILAACERRGILHGDVKPSNIFLDKEGHYRLGDFGAACRSGVSAVDGHPRWGTPRYMAPEAVRGQSEGSDVYSLGMVLYRYLNHGLLPFVPDASEKEVWNDMITVRLIDIEAAAQRRIAGKPIPAPKNADGPLAAVVLRALAYEPGRRYASAADFGAALQELQEPGGGRGRGESPFPPLNPFASFPSADGPQSGRPVFSPTGRQRGRSLSMDQVSFSVLAPDTVECGETAMVNIVMYEESYRYVVDRLMEPVKGRMLERNSVLRPYTRGIEVTVKLSSPDVEIEDDTLWGLWQGRYLCVVGFLELPEDYPRRSLRLRANVCLDGVICTQLSELIRVVPSAVPQEKRRRQVREPVRRDIHSVFVSYSSEDRIAVARIIQGIRAVRRDLDIFLDVLSLRGGEHWEERLYPEIDGRDALFLCWSENAAKSEWVEREWRHALQQKGIDAISLILVEKYPLPGELSSLHGNDLLLYVIEAEEREKAKKQAGKNEQEPKEEEKRKEDLKERGGRERGPER